MASRWNKKIALFWFVAPIYITTVIFVVYIILLPFLNISIVNRASVVLMFISLIFIIVGIILGLFYLIRNKPSFNLMSGDASFVKQRYIFFSYGQYPPGIWFKLPGSLPLRSLTFLTIQGDTVVVKNFFIFYLTYSKKVFSLADVEEVIYGKLLIGLELFPDYYVVFKLRGVNKAFMVGSSGGIFSYLFLRKDDIMDFVKALPKSIKFTEMNKTVGIFTSFWRVIFPNSL